MTPERLAELRRQAESVRGLPWMVAGGNRIVAPKEHQRGFPGATLRIGETFGDMMNGPSDPNALNAAAYIVAACNAIPELLDEYDRLAAQVVVLREALEGAGNLVGTDEAVPLSANRARMCCGAWGDKPHREGCWIGNVLADTEAAAATSWLEANDREQRLAGAKEAMRELRHLLAEHVGSDFRHSRIKDSYDADVTAVLEAMERGA